MAAISPFIEPGQRAAARAYFASRQRGASEILAMNNALRAYLYVHAHIPPLQARAELAALMARAEAEAPGWYWLAKLAR